MGLNITGNLVDVDHTHNQLLNTGRHGNPVVQYVPEGRDELRVYSTFLRHKAPRSRSRDRDNRIRGDNCALLYALKQKDGLHTTFGAIRRLMLHFDAILEDMVDQSDEYDVVVPMPSGHTISQQFGRRLALRYDCRLQGGLFKKISNTRAHELLAQSNLPSSEKSKLRARIPTEDGDFSLKNVPTGFRDIFPPVTLEGALPADCTRFLLADDLLSTGTTLLAAQRQILQAIPDARVDAACLFSRV